MALTAEDQAVGLAQRIALLRAARGDNHPEVKRYDAGLSLASTSSVTEFDESLSVDTPAIRHRASRGEPAAEK